MAAVASVVSPWLGPPQFVCGASCDPFAPLAFKGCELCFRELHVRSCCDAHSESARGQNEPPTW
jgi:hypothetical protein